MIKQVGPIAVSACYEIYVPLNREREGAGGSESLKVRSGSLCTWKQFEGCRSAVTKMMHRLCDDLEGYTA